MGFFSRKTRPATGSPPRRRFRPRLETLEDRCVPASGWLMTTSVVGSDPVTDLAQDTDGNTYVTGYFAGTLTIGSTTLTSNAGSQDLFVAKLDADGGLLWANRFGGAGREYGMGIDVGSDGSAYVTGCFNGSMTFPAESGGITLTSVGGSDLLVFKLDADGNGLWAQRGGSTTAELYYGEDCGHGIALDSSGNAYVNANFRGTAQYGATTPMTASGYKDQALIKLSSDGEFVWAKQLGGPGDETARDVVVDASDNVFVGGGFLARFDTAGNQIWSNGPGVECSLAVYQDATTGEGYLYTADLTLGGVKKLDADTGAALWEKTIIADSRFHGVAADAAGNVFLMGPFMEGSGNDFDPGPGTFYMTSTTWNDIFLLKLNSAGDFVSARRMGGTAYEDISHDVEVDAAGNVFMCGEWGGTGEFDIGDSTVVRTSPSGEGQGFILKMTQGLGAVSGRVFADADNNGNQGTDEPFMAGVTVYLDQDNDGIRDTGEASATTGAFGDYAFIHLAAGTYNVRQVAPAGWAGSAPTGGAHVVTLAADQFLGDRNFGAYRAPTTTTYTKNTSLKILDLKTVTSTIVVSGGTSFIYDLDVSIKIDHANDADLDFGLIAPDGTRVELTTDNGGTGDNYTNTIFDDEAASAITAGTAPFTGRYRPEGMLNVLDGKNANGTWTLEVSDDTKKNTGTLLNWSLTVKGASPGTSLLAVDGENLANPSAETLTAAQLQPLLAEAIRRWQVTGADVSSLSNLNVEIADLSAGMLGMAGGNTIWLDANAAGYGWFVDPTPFDDSEFTLFGDQGEQGRMDLLTALTHEIGHILGHDHDFETARRDGGAPQRRRPGDASVGDRRRSGVCI